MLSISVFFWISLISSYNAQEKKFIRDISRH